MQNLVYKWVDFSKFFPKFEPKLVKFTNILEKSGDYAQNWANWYMMNRSLFLEKLVFEWVYYQIPQRRIPTKTKLEYPFPGVSYRACSSCSEPSKVLQLAGAKILHHEDERYPRWIRESIWIRRRGAKAMNNEGGAAYYLSHQYDHLIQSNSRNTSSRNTNSASGSIHHM